VSLFKQPGWQYGSKKWAQCLAAEKFEIEVAGMLVEAEEGNKVDYDKYA